jgi:crotonobetainyl-CoA:carnitine CoA-transferase CaiB-like acyl-CoA transferase
MSAMIGDAFLEYSVCGRVPERNGNRDPIMEPHSCYRCADDPGEPDESRWLSLAVDTEEEWAALKTVLADPELEDEAFATPDGRRRERERLDAAIERWTRRREPAAAAEILQRAGVAALPVQTSRSLSQDPHVRERGVLTRVAHPVVGERIVVGPPWKLAGAAVRGPAPLIGAHTEAVLSEVLGMSREEIEKLAETGALD